MAVVNTLSTIVTALDASKKVPLHLMGGRLKEQRATVEIAAADSNTSTYRLFRVHSSWVISEILRHNDTLTSGTSWDVGLYRIAADGGAVVDADVWMDNTSLATASTAGVRDTWTSLNIDKIEKRIWEVLALTADPNLFYDLTWTAVAKGSATGTLSVTLRYVEGV